MTGHIPETFIDELLNRSDIVALIQSRVELKRAGTNFIARCPFHNEKTPSFTVSQNKQFYHCFGCGAHGNAVRFLMEYEGLHFVEAVESLAERIGMVVPKDSFENPEKLKKYSDIYATLEVANHYFQAELRKAPLPERAIQYLKRRGLSKQILIDFNLGYAPNQWDGLVSALGKNKTQIDNLLSAGLIIAKENKPYFDRFRDRIMFPIRNRKGQVIGFGGRTIENQMPKYLNSPETLVFNKSQTLYGLFEARLKLKQFQTLIVVEGYLDVLSLVQFGIKNVVATLGTALSEKHLDILFRETQEIIFCFDGDAAGRAAARKVLLLSLAWMREGRRIKFALLPEKEDPDSMVRKEGGKAFEERLHLAKNFSDFLFESYTANLDLNHVEGRAECVRILRPLIAKIPRGILQDMLQERLADLASVSIHKLKKTNFSNKKKDLEKNRKNPLPPAYKASAFLLANPSLLRYIETPHGLKIEGEGVGLLCAIIQALNLEPELKTEALLESLRKNQDIQSEFGYLSNYNSVVESVPKEGIESEFVGAMERLKQNAKDSVVEELLMRAKQSPLSLQDKRHLKELLDQKG